MSGDPERQLGDKEQGFSLLFSALGLTLGPSLFGYGVDDWGPARIALGALFGGVGHVLGAALGRWLDGSERR